MTSQPTSTARARSRYDANYTQVLALLEELRAQVERHRTNVATREAETGRPVNWAHVGDMTRYREGLAELLGRRG